MAETKVTDDRRKGERRKDAESAKKWMGMQRRLGERRLGNLREIYKGEQLPVR